MIPRNVRALGLSPLPSRVRAFVTSPGTAKHGPVEHDAGEHELLPFLGNGQEARYAVGRAYKPVPSSHVRVSGPEGFEGYVDISGRLVRKGVPLRFAYLTRVATDWGAEHEINAVLTLQRLAGFEEWAHEFVREWYTGPLGPGEPNDALEFLYKLRDTYSRGLESQYGDGYCAACNPLWSAACWDVFGEERVFPCNFAY